MRSKPGRTSWASKDLVITVITTNADAARLYERRGAVPFLTDLVQSVRLPEQRTNKPAD